MKKQPIAIIGGMGPEASVYLYNVLIKQSIDSYGAVNNDDFPEIVLYSVPVPDFISSNERRNEAFDILKEKVESLNSLNPLCIAIACNTAHVLINDLQNLSHVPFVSMIDEIVEAVLKDKINKVGLLGTPSTPRSGMYQNAFRKVDIETILPENSEIDLIENIVRKVIAGTTDEKDKENLEKIANVLKKKGVKGIILGCTELPLVFPSEYSVSIYNSVDILSRALLRNYYS